MRAELTPTQMAEHLAKRKELWGARVNSVATCNTNPGRPRGFDTDTAEKTGVNRSTVNRAVSRAEGVTQEACRTNNGHKKNTPMSLSCRENSFLNLP